MIILKIKNIELNIEELLKEKSVIGSMHSLRENNLFLSDEQIEVLNKYKINYQEYTTVSSLIYAIDERLSFEEIDELEDIASMLSEYQYYNEVNK